LLDMYADATSIFEHFQVNNSLPYEAGMPWMKSDVLVFRKKGRPSVFVPKTPAHAFLLHHRAEGRKLSNCSLEELRNLCPTQTDTDIIKE